MPNIVKITVENADELLNAGSYDAGALIRVQSSATEGGAFVDLSGTGSTPTIALVSGTRIYTAYDPNGTTTTWYKVRYENSGGTRTSDYSAAFQVGGETAGYLCSLYDAKQRLFPPGHTDTTEDEAILGYIAQASRFIENRTGRWFAPRSSATYLFSPPVSGRMLWVPRGVRAVTALGYATTDQPDTGGTFTSIASTDYSLQPAAGNRNDGWPATRIALLDTSGSYFYAGINRVQVTMTTGFAAVPPDIEQIALNLVVAAHRERGSVGSVADSFTINVDGSRTFSRLLSYTDRMTLDWYTDHVVAA